MPIKFRCSYCRQFLGISRGRSGEMVDCPTCGRSIRVPGLDGSTAPVATPEWDAQDAHLLRALDELAALANPPQPRNESASVATVDAEVEPDSPQPLLEPLPIEVAMPAVVPIREAAIAPTSMPPALTESPVQHALGDSPWKELAPLADAAPPMTTTVTSRPQAWPIWLLLAPSLAIVLGFGAGWLANRGMTTNHTISSPIAPPLPGPIDESVTVKGRITWRTKVGASQPDAGATIIVLPAVWRGESRLAPIGLRGSDGEADQAVAAASVAAMGGGLARADEQGEYEVRCSKPGDYRVLVVSRFQGVAGDPTLNDDDRQSLSGYFTEPLAILGRVAWTWQPLSLQDAKRTTWDHTFVAE